MNALQRAVRYREKQKQLLGPHSTYFEIDTLIKPLCELMNDAGYMTLYSCSGHVKIDMRKKYQEQWNNIQLDYLTPYIMFVAPVSIKPIQAAIRELQQLGYNVQLTYNTDHPAKLTRLWSFHLRKCLNLATNDDKLYEIHSITYSVFKKHLTKTGT